MTTPNVEEVLERLRNVAGSRRSMAFLHSEPSLSDECIAEAEAVEFAIAALEQHRWHET